MIELKTKIPEARYSQNSPITLQIFFRNEKSQPNGKEMTLTAAMTKSLFYPSFKTKLDWQLAKAESLAG
jgi:hypothetical protein